MQYYEVIEEITSPDNVMRMGELLALQSLKFMCGHKQLHRMYANYDKIMRKPKLNKGEKETLNCYMQGIGFVQQAKMLSLNPSTIWKRRKSMQNKYLAIVDTL